MPLTRSVAEVHAVCLSERHGFSKQPQSRIHLLAGQGVRGDAHCGATVQHLYLKRRNAAAPNLMQVHLLPLEVLTEFARNGYQLAPGDLGENITTEGIDLHTLPLGTELHLGSNAVVELTGLRTPCAKIDRFRPGLLRHAYVRTDSRPRQARVGVMATIRFSGDVCAADPIQCVLPSAPHLPLREI